MLSLAHRDNVEWLERELAKDVGHVTHFIGEHAHSLEHDVHDALVALDVKRRAVVAAAANQLKSVKPGAKGKGVAKAGLLQTPAATMQPSVLEQALNPLHWSRSARTLLAGAGSAAVSKTATAPLEVVRVRLMAGGGKHLGAVVAETWASGGASAFFRGNAVNVLRTIPTKSIQYGSFDAIKLALTFKNAKGEDELPPWASSFAGAAAGVISTIATHPLETIQTRLTVSSAYKGVGDAFISIVRKEGPRALFGGITPSLIGIIPYSGLNLGTYDALRYAYTKHTGRPVPKGASLAFGALAGATAASACFPLEVVRRRAMMGQVYANPAAAMISIAQKEGVQALFAGLGINWVKVAPMSGLSLWSYEIMKEMLHV